MMHGQKNIKLYMGFFLSRDCLL